MEGSGVNPETYMETFGEPKEVRGTKLPMGVNSPPLPGLEDLADVYAETVEDMEEALLKIKASALTKWAIENKRAVLNGNDGLEGVLLTEEEAETWMDDNSEDISWYSTEAYEEFRDDIEDMLDGCHDWEVEGTNLDWRHSSGSMTLRQATATDVTKLITASEYTPSLEKVDGGFRLSFTHHDCPVNPTVMVFTRLDEY
jgi:hypothetical protein